MGSDALAPRAVTTVLLLDDFAPQLNAWERELVAAGKRVFLATDRRAARQLAARHHPDVAIVDLYLGLENGLDAVRELKAIDPAMFVAVVSSNLTVALAMGAVHASADDACVKPVRCTDLVRRVERGVHVDASDASNNAKLTLDQVEWEHISRALVECGDNITHAAAQLGVYRQTLQRKLRKRGLTRAP